MKSPRLPHWKPQLLFIAGLGFIAFAYSFALPGIFLFDDAPNLERLSTLSDWRSLLSFVLSGEAGPIGRPIALATFAFQKAAWPNHPESMLTVNITIHILSVIAVFILTLGLVQAKSLCSYHRNLWIATAISLLWGLSPFLATTHLMIIQRMTSLAGLFVFLGLGGFVWAHLLAERHKLLSWVLLVLGLGFCSILATLSKENGALLPVLAVIILWLWIPKSLHFTTQSNRVTVIVLVILPTLLILFYYLFSTIQILENGYGPHRQFTPIQRLLTQPTILIDYLKNLFLPRAIMVTPFTDDATPASGLLNKPITLISILLWAALAFLAILFRKKAPYLLFGLTFFLVAHLFESSIFGLELYFAHRNYVPAFGVYFVIVFLIASFPVCYSRIASIALGSYGFLFFIVLVQATSQWNQIEIASEMWLQNKPHSARAAQFLTNQYFERNEPSAALAILDDWAEKNPHNATIQLQRTIICHSREHSYQNKLSVFKNIISTFPLDRSVAAELMRIAKSDIRNYCAKLDYSDLTDIADAFLSNGNFEEYPYTKSHLLIAKGFAEAEQGNIPQATQSFVNSFYAYPHLDTAFTAMSLMSNAGLYSEAGEFLKKARQSAPSNFIKRIIWLQQLDIFSAILEQSRVIDESSRMYEDIRGQGKQGGQPGEPSGWGLDF